MGLDVKYFPQLYVLALVLLLLKNKDIQCISQVCSDLENRGVTSTFGNTIVAA